VFLAEAWAVPVAIETPALVIPLDELHHDSSAASYRELSNPTLLNARWLLTDVSAESHDEERSEHRTVIVRQANRGRWRAP